MILRLGVGFVLAVLYPESYATNMTSPEEYFHLFQRKRHTICNHPHSVPYYHRPEFWQPLTCLPNLHMLDIPH